MGILFSRWDGISEGEELPVGSPEGFGTGVLGGKKGETHIPSY
jgi:hypothetical protein